MAIAFDATSGGNTGGGTATSLTYSHVCSGSKRILFVGVDIENTSVSITGVTYNGVAMTLITGIDVTTQVRTKLFYLINPTSGSNNVIVSTNSSASIQSCSTSYTGANQTTQPDAFNSASSTFANTLSTNVNVINSGCWIVGFGGVLGGTNFSAGTGFTARNSSRYSYIQDSNGIVSTGNIATGYNFTSGGSIPMVIIGASFNVEEPISISISTGVFTITGNSIISNLLNTISLATGTFAITGRNIITTLANKFMVQVKNISTWINQNKS